MPESRKKKKAGSQAPRSRKKAETHGGSADGSGTSGEAEAVEEPLVPAGEEPVAPELEVSQPDYPVEQDKPEWAMESGNGRGVKQLLGDREFMDQVITGMVRSRILDSLAEDIADELGDILEDSPEFKQRLIDAVMSDETSKGKLIKAVLKELG